MSIALTPLPQVHAFDQANGLVDDGTAPAAPVIRTVEHRLTGLGVGLFGGLGR